MLQLLTCLRLLQSALYTKCSQHGCAADDHRDKNIDLGAIRVPEGIEAITKVCNPAVAYGPFEETPTLSLMSHFAISH